jgi:hypothetical protein
MTYGRHHRRSRFFHATETISIVKERPVAFVVKAALGAAKTTASFSFTEKTMYSGKEIGVDDEVFVFDSDHEGGQGLCARGIVTSVARGPGIRLSIDVRPVARAKRNLGRKELKPFRDLDDGRPETEIARKLYRQATNKIARVSDDATAFLKRYF